MIGLEELLYSLAVQMGYVGVFLVSLIGASSVVIPIPYTLIFFLLGANPSMDAVPLILAGAFGSTAGEFVGYSIGYAAKSVVSEKRQRRFSALLRIVMRHKKVWPFIVFIFALTPLPDDLLFIPLGLIRYNFLRVLIPAFLGKLTMISLLLYWGRYTRSFIESAMGGDAGFTFPIFTAVSAALLVITISVIWKIDWEKLAKRYEDLTKDLTKMMDSRSFRRGTKEEDSE